MTATSRGGRSSAQVTVRTVALALAFVVLLVTALIVDRTSRWHVVALALLAVSFGISLAQWMDLRRSH